MYGSISVIVPVYNSSQSIQELCRRLVKALTAITEVYEIILVDDSSIDDSFIKMKTARNSNAAIKLIRLSENFGQQNAIMCGLRHAKGDYVITIDDDLQNPPEELATLMKSIENGYDVVYGIPIARRHSAVRNLGSIMTDHLFNIVCGKPKQVKVSSFRIMKKSIVEKIIEEKASFVYISAITLRHTKNIGNAIVVHEQRKYGSSNYNIKKLAKLFYNIYINYSRISNRMVQNTKPQYVIKESYL
ncbi:MAG: glycosyltransferase family 2 protein [Lutisporaceae bacterium]